MSARALVVVVVSTALIATGCVASERSAFVKARRAYRECLEANPEDPDTCSHLEAESNRRAEEYGDHAARSWGCTHTPDRCDEPRR
jgi:hypothetical protein